MINKSKSVCFSLSKDKFTEAQLLAQQSIPAIQAKKRFAQNFLVNESIKRQVLQAVNTLVEQDQPQFLLEIGPGRGDLTEKLLEIPLPIFCYEIDPEAVTFLQVRFEHYLQKQLILRQADALSQLALVCQNAESQAIGQRLPNEHLLSRLSSENYNPFAGNYLLVSSLPYNLGSRILVELAIQNPSVSFVVIVQKEVAQKVLPSTKLTFFGAWLNLFWDLQLSLVIAPGNFQPRPKVWSALLVGKTKRLENQRKTASDQEKMSLRNLDYTQRLLCCQILKQLFKLPKKNLSNNLLELKLESQQGDSFSLFENKRQAECWLMKHSIEPQERLSWNNYQDLLLKLYSYSSEILSTKKI